MTSTLLEPQTHGRTDLAIIDCDIHPALKSPKALHPYLSERWRRHRDTIGDRGFGGAAAVNTSASRLRSALMCFG